MPADPNRVRDVFLAAVELPLDRRPAYLVDACRGDAGLLAEVDRLLVANADPDSILEPLSPTHADATGAFVLGDPGTVDLHGKTSATDAFDSDAPRPNELATEDRGPDGVTGSFANPGPDATTARELTLPASRAARVPTCEGIGTVIAGRYTLVEVIGEGGMGSVYLASQTEPVKRQVALKLIKTGIDSKAVLARFDAERQALALMDHPNIARIYDGGVTPAGQPFFVMELVRGVPLTEYCDQKRLSVPARLELFVAVCQAVQHAHQKGIIHRDLKPGNVLATDVDGRPTPKIIDFGVAKATEVKLTDMSLADVGAIVGTPTYMSPEQAEPSSTDIDTRTDVYALGVMLYELLTGSTPLDAKQFQRGAILEMLRIVREVDPPRPSTKLSTAEALPNIAANRSIEPARLAKLLQGELDWVVMKALEKDRTRRYETASGFARDIERYLADEVVEARPPSRGYRLKKFVKRNKGQVIAASLVLLALVAGIVGTSWGMWEANLARIAELKRADGERNAKIDAQRARDAEAEQRAAAVVERDKAIASEAKTQAINEFLTRDLLTQAEPANNAVEDKVTLLEVLDRAAEKVGTRFADQPVLERDLRQTIAGTYHGLASWEKAETQCRAVYDAARQRDPRSVETFLAQGELAHIRRHRGQRDAEIPEMAEASAKGLERTLGPEAPQTLTALGNLALVYQSVGKLPGAIALFERVRDAQIAKLGPDHMDTLITLNNLASVYQAASRLREAIALFERVRDAFIAKFGPDHPHTLVTLNNLAVAYAHATLQEQLAEARRTLPKDSPQLAGLLAQIGVSLLQQRKWAEAEPLLRECLALREKSQPDLWSTFNTQSMLGAALLGQKKYDEAEPLLRKGYEGMKHREKTIPTQASTRLPDALDRLIDLLTATNKPEVVKMWQAERAKYPEAAAKPGEKK